jgi:hypothetical protein
MPTTPAARSSATTGVPQAAVPRGRHDAPGVHVIGELATEIVHVGLTAMLLGGDADLFIQACFNYPTLTEVYKYATYDALGQKVRSQGLAPGGAGTLRWRGPRRPNRCGSRP